MGDTSEKNSELDEYGVWVKSPATNSNKEQTPAEEDFSDLSILETDELEFQDDFKIDDLDIDSSLQEQDKTIEAEDSSAEVLPDVTELDSISEVEDFSTNEPVEELQEQTTEINHTEDEALADELSKLTDFEIEEPKFDVNQDEQQVEQAEIQEIVSEEEPLEPEEKQADTVATDLSNFEDGEIDLDSFMDSGDSLPTSDGDVDLSAFMGSDSGTSSFSDGDIDLDAFMGGEAFSTDKEEQAEIEEADPLDIDLDFEGSGFEFEDEGNSNSQESASDDFDALFSDIQDVQATTTTEISESEFLQPSTPAESSNSETESIDLSDFGFDDSSDNQNPLIDTKEEKKAEGPVDYEMNIDMEDDEPTAKGQEPTTEIVNNDDNDDIQVDITRDEKTAIQKEQETDLSSPDDDFDIDSIFDNIQDENGETVDFSEPTVEQNTEDEIEEEISVPKAEDNSDNSINFLEETESQKVLENPVEDSTIETFETPIVEEQSSEAFDLPDFDTVENDSEKVEDTSDSSTVDEQAIKSEDLPTFDEQENALEEQSTEAFDLPDFDSLENDSEKIEDASDSSTVDEQTIESEDLPTFDEQESVLEEPVDSFEIPTEDSEEIAEPIVESSVEEDASEISLDDFMGEEGFTDGGPGVTGPYNEDGTLIQRDEAKTEEEQKEEPVVAEEQDMEEEAFVDEDLPEINVFEEETEPTLEQSETLQEEPDLENVEDSQETSENVEATESQISEKLDTGDLDVSSYLDNGSDYDMTGVSVTLDSLENLVSEPEQEQTSAEEPIEQEVSVSENTENEEEKQTYCVFVSSEKTTSNKLEEDEPQIESKTEQIENSEENVLQENKLDESNQILNKIADELASLKSEIDDLKGEFEELKKSNNSVEKYQTEENDFVESEPEQTEEKQGDSGFFNDTDEDDTIALSGDELNNILSSAEFTSQDGDSLEQQIETPVEVEQTEEVLEEPTIAEIQEDVLVESSDSDLMNVDVINDAIQQPTEEDDEVENPTEFPNELSVPAATLESLDLDTSETEPLTETNIEFLKSEVPQELSEEEKEDDIEVGISEQPVENVFDNWNSSASSEEKNDEENVIKEEVPTVQTSIEASETKEVSDRSNEIPADMKEEIKSVLAYMDQLLENLPEEKIAEFAQSEQFETYKKLFSELGLA